MIIGKKELLGPTKPYIPASARRKEDKIPKTLVRAIFILVMSLQCAHCGGVLEGFKLS